LIRNFEYSHITNEYHAYAPLEHFLYCIGVQEAGRLLYAGQDDWVHINCALWSAEVYEEGDGSLQMVHLAIARGRKLVISNLSDLILGSLLLYLSSDCSCCWVCLV